MNAPVTQPAVRPWSLAVSLALAAAFPVLAALALYQSFRSLTMEHLRADAARAATIMRPALDLEGVDRLYPSTPEGFKD